MESDGGKKLAGACPKSSGRVPEWTTRPLVPPRTMSKTPGAGIR